MARRYNAIVELRKRHLGKLQSEASVIVVKESGEGSQQRLRVIGDQILQSIRHQQIKFPMLPHAATQALALANRTDASMKDLVRAVAADQMISARALAIANSPAYGGHLVRGLVQALQRLGTGTIRDVLYQAVADSHIFRGDDAQALQAERKHALAVGHLCRSLCEVIGRPSDHAFVSGLLHDIGRTLLLDLLPRFCDDSVATDEQQLLIERLHPVLGAHLARAWSLPGWVSEACRRHHVYKGSRVPSGYSLVGNVVQAAEAIADGCGAGRPVREVDPCAPCFTDLGLEPDKVAGLVATAEELMAA